MPIFERPPLDTLAPAKDRWTPIYLEYGRIEVDDSSIKWIGSDGLITRLPVATLSALILGPGTSVTHAESRQLHGPPPSRLSPSIPRTTAPWSARSSNKKSMKPACSAACRKI